MNSIKQVIWNNKVDKSDFRFWGSFLFVPVLDSLVEPIVKHVFNLSFLVLFELFLPRRIFNVFGFLDNVLKYHSSQLFDNVIDYFLREQGHMGIQHSINFNNVFPISFITYFCHHVFSV